MSDVSKTNELIKEANVVSTNDVVANPRRYRNLIGRLANALEAATRVPVQGEPNDDREAIIAAIDEIRNPFGRATRSQEMLVLDSAEKWAERATVPDATTERELKAVKEHREKWMARAFRAETERDAALARIAEATEVHEEDHKDCCGGKGYCRECYERWPCPTVVALDGAPEPEWEREYRRVRPDGVPVFNAVFETMPLLDDYYTAEYRTVSPWLPVEGEKL